MEAVESQASANSHSSAPSRDSLSEYFNMRKPATIEAAERHLKATRMKNLESIELSTLAPEARCECCSYPIESPSFTHIDSLSQLGLAFPLYFYLSRFIMAMLLIVSLVAAIPATISNNSLGTKSKLVFVNFSITMHDEEMPLWPVVLHLVAIILLCFTYAYMSLWMKAKIVALDDGVYTPSDFAALVKGLGNNWSSDELKKHIEENMKPDEKSPLNVVDIIPCFDLAEYERIKKCIGKFKSKAEIHLKQQSQSKLRRCWNALVCAGPITEEELKAEMAKLDGEVAEIKRKNWIKTGVAIVVFGTNTQAKAFIKKWKRGLMKGCLCCCRSAMDDPLHFKGKHIYVKGASEPSDMLWGNLKYSRLYRILFQFFAAVIVIEILFTDYYLLSIISYMKMGKTAREVAESGEASKFGYCHFDDNNPNPNPNPVNSRANYFLSDFANYTQSESGKFLFVQSVYRSAKNETAEYFGASNDESAPDPEEPTKKEIEKCFPENSWAISILLSVGITALNKATSILAQLISRYYERHHTYTTERSFSSWKLIIFLSFNSILAPLLANMRLPDLNTEEGLSQDIMFLAMNLGSIIIVLKIMMPLLFFLKRKVFRSFSITHTFFSQKSLNAQFEYPEADVSGWYVSLICNFLLTLAYTPLIPIIVPIILYAILIDYIYSRRVLFRYSRLPKTMNQRMTNTVMLFVKVGIVLYAVGMTASSMRTINKQAEYICYAALAVSIVFFFIPTKIFKPLFGRSLPKSSGEEEKMYEEKAENFIFVSDIQRYESVNPVLRVQRFAERSQDDSDLKWFLFEQDSETSLPDASECFARAKSRLQSQVADVPPVSSDYVRMYDARVNN